MSRGDDVELADDAWLDDLEDAEDEGFGRGWTAAKASAERCCAHQPDCPLVLERQPWWRRAARRILRGGDRR